MTQSDPHVSILIVGDTLEAWLAAAYLSRVLGKTRLGVAIVPFGTAGNAAGAVAALPGAVDFHAALGFDERDMLRFCGGCFRLGTVFEDWSADGARFVHAYGAPPPSPGEGQFHHYWNRMRLESKAEPYHKYSLAAELAEADRFVHPPQDAGAPGRYRYGYHLNADRYREYMKRAARHYGVAVIEADAAEPLLMQDRAGLAGLRLAGGRIVTADTYVDATGAAILAAALAGSDPKPDDVLPFDTTYSVVTAPSALTHERIVAHPDSLLVETPTVHALCRTLMFDARTLPQTEAASRLGEGGAFADLKLGWRHPWRGNCLAIGGSAFRLGPLEAAPLQIAMLGILRFAELLPGEGAESIAAAEYNRRMLMSFGRLRDFQEMHFASSRHPWAVSRGDLSRENGIRLEQFLSRGRVVTFDDETFSPESWVSIMLGHGQYPGRVDPLATVLRSEDVSQRLQGLRAYVQKAVEKVPAQRAYLEQAKATAPPSERSPA